MTTTDGPASITALVFAGRSLPPPLSRVPAVIVSERGDIDAALSARRIIVVGADSDLATVLGRLLRADRLDIEVGFVPRRWSARRALSGTARRVPLIRDETGTVIVGAALWLPREESARGIEGEAVVDDTVLFDGTAPAVRIEPIDEMPGLRARVLGPRLRPRNWVAGRAAQLGTPGARVVRDGAPVTKPVRRSTFYRHTEGWLRVR